MRRILCLAALAVGTESARAEIVVETPWVTVRVGRPRIVVPPPPVVVPAQPVPAPTLPPAVLPAPVPVPAQPAPAPAVVRVPTLAEFAATFQPMPGTHKAVIVHPVTGCPVEVCFTLPPGCPRVKLHRRNLEFDYGKCEVDLQFLRNGRVNVDY